MGKNKKVRIVVASVLIILGIGSLLFWEMWGREYVTYDYVIVASKNIKPGDIITDKVITEKGMQKNNIISNAIKKEDAEKIIGMISKQNIVKGSQIHMSYLATAEKYINKGESIYKIPNDWIGSCSSSIRRGDIVEIYRENGESFGQYKVAFVKDVQEREITSTDNKYQETLDRVESTGVINNIEIIASLEKFNLMKQVAYNSATEMGEKFVIVQIINKES